MEYIEREYYTNRIKPYINKQIIKVFIGQRRVGKSNILLQTIDYIKRENENSNIIYINKELYEFSSIKTSSDLYSVVKESIITGKDNFLFIDEVQDINEFEIAVRSLFAENCCDIYLTSSNALILSGELATYLSGRYIRINIHSLSYQEFLTFHVLQDTEDSLLNYLKFGGMPYLKNIGLKDNLPFEYLKNVYSTILLKDVISRAGIRNVQFLENLVEYLADNCGSTFSANNISKYLKSQHINLNLQQIISYLKSLTNAFLIYRVSRTEVNGLKIFEIGEKYYFEDTGLRNVIHGYNQKTDLGKLMENAVYIHLIRNDYNVYVGKLGSNEIDFVAERNGLKVYFQVCLQISNKETFQREFGNLQKITDNYPKYVITFNDPLIGENYNGIKQINLKEFLSTNKF